MGDTLIVNTGDTGNKTGSKEFVQNADPVTGAGVEDWARVLAYGKIDGKSPGVDGQALGATAGTDAQLKLNNDNSTFKFAADANKSLGPLDEKFADKEVKRRMDAGEVVPPDGKKPSPEDRADELARDLASFKFEDRMSIGPAYGPERQNYNSIVDTFGKRIDENQKKIAQEHWDKLSPAEQEEIQKDLAASAILPLGDKQGTKGPFDKFKEKLAQDPRMVELEKERKAMHMDVWSKLSNEAKEAIIREDVIDKSWKDNMPKISEDPKEKLYEQLSPALEKYMNTLKNKRQEEITPF